MLERIGGGPDGIVAVRAVGKITGDDYAQLGGQMLDARERNRRLRVLLELGPEYEGFTAGAMWGARPRPGPAIPRCGT